MLKHDEDNWRRHLAHLGLSSIISMIRRVILECRSNFLSHKATVTHENFLFRYFVVLPSRGFVFNKFQLGLCVFYYLFAQYQRRCDGLIRNGTKIRQGGIFKIFDWRHQYSTTVTLWVR